MATVNNLPNSLRWGVMQTLLTALQAAPALSGVLVIRNPRSPKSLTQGAHMVFLKDQRDTLTIKPGQTERRAVQFLLGTVAHTDTADSDADALHEAAADVLRAALPTLTQACRVVNLSETDTQFEAAGLEIDGALCLSTWALEYIKPRSH
jgi:hypothetical protein